MYKLPVGHAPGSKKNLEPETVLRSPHIFGWLRVAKALQPPPPEFCIRPCVPTICSGGIAVVLSVKVAPCQHYLNDVRIKNLLHPR